MEIVMRDPNKLFCDHLPYAKIWEKRLYNDLTELNMTTYLQILTSVGLYGIKYAVEVKPSLQVIDGDFRVYAARELGLLVPTVMVKRTENRSRLGKFIIAFIRHRIVRRNSFLRKKWLNPFFKWNGHKIVLVCHFQKNLFT